MTDDNPLRNPMTTLLNQSVTAAAWLNGAEQYAAAIHVARMLARQVDEVQVEGADPEALKQLHIRILPNFTKALHALGLTPEGYARMTGVGAGKAGQGAGQPDESGTPFGKGRGLPDPAAALSALIDESDNVTRLGVKT